VDFHKQQPLFVSGGDDYKIKVFFRQTIIMVYGILVTFIWMMPVDQFQKRRYDG
jgi:hypothetical protein